MGSSPIVFHILLFLYICSQALGMGCGLSSIQVDQHATGARAGVDFEFEVEIKNTCGCAQADVRVHAPGFASQKPVSPGVFRPDGDAFLVNDGKPIPAGSAVKFGYWWDHHNTFSPAGSRAICT